MGRVRPFVQNDIPQVAGLHWRVLHGKVGHPPPAAETYLEQLFFLSPWSDSTLPSFVYEDERGAVVGFQGVVPRQMSLFAKPIQAAYGTGLVVHPDSRYTLAGFHLTKAFFSGKQDLSLTDTANYVSEQVWGALGGITAVSYGTHWSRPLRPALYGLHGLSRFASGALSTVLTAFKPLSRAIDAFVTRLPSCPFRLSWPILAAEVPDVDTLLVCLSDSSGLYSLQPEYKRDSLRWVLDFMGQMKTYGDLRQLVLRDQTGKMVGWYIYYVTRGGIGEVVRIGAADHAICAVLDHLFHDASARGAIALHGRLETRLAQPLSEKCCFFYQASNRLLVHSRRPELLRLINQNDALLTRLDGEWCLRSSYRSLPRQGRFANRNKTGKPIPSPIYLAQPSSGKSYLLTRPWAGWL